MDVLQHQLPFGTQARHLQQRRILFVPEYQITLIMKGCVFREIQNTVKIFRLQTLKVYIYQPVILQTPGRPDKVLDITKHQHTTFQITHRRRSHDGIWLHGIIVSGLIDDIHTLRHTCQLK